MRRSDFPRSRTIRLMIATELICFMMIGLAASGAIGSWSVAALACIGVICGLALLVTWFVVTELRNG